MKKIISGLILLTLVFSLFTACAPKEEHSGENVSFNFEVIYEDGQTENLTITTSEQTVGKALLKENIIEGEDGPYGLYVKKVKGHLADFEKTGTYWAFYIDGEYATTGAEKTKIKEGSTYTFKVEK